MKDFQPRTPVTIMVLWMATITLLPGNSSASRSATIHPLRIVPNRSAHYQWPNAPSSCACRVKCMTDDTCAAVSVQGTTAGPTNCFFTYGVFDSAQLVEDASSFTYTHDATTVLATTTSATTSPTTVTTTTEATTTTSTATTPTTTTTTTTPPPPTTTSTTTETSSTSTTTRTWISTSFRPIFYEDARCGNFWYRYETTCYLPSVLDGSWSRAKSYCEIYPGAYLVQITSANESYIIENLLNSKIQNTYWIGLKKDSITSQYVWDVDNTAPTFQNWESGRPQGFGCVYMNTNNKWYDESCSLYTPRRVNQSSVRHGNELYNIRQSLGFEVVPGCVGVNFEHHLVLSRSRKV
ncbi:uncharacterized protein LOC135195733 [Macrobrachium nipponense]|uniref:uncharacterized protein LOC135195733 n=1 Tax=Macrobrachium nipponense TaxID=159736 RepID=UPI0030C8887A